MLIKNIQENPLNSYSNEIVQKDINGKYIYYPELRPKGEVIIEIAKILATCKKLEVLYLNNNNLVSNTIKPIIPLRWLCHISFGVFHAKYESCREV